MSFNTMKNGLQSPGSLTLLFPGLDIVQILGAAIVFTLSDNFSNICLLLIFICILVMLSLIYKIVVTS